MTWGWMELCMDEDLHTPQPGSKRRGGVRDRELEPEPDVGSESRPLHLLDCVDSVVLHFQPARARLLGCFQPFQRHGPTILDPYL